MTDQEQYGNIEQEMFKDPEAYKSLVNNVNIGIFQTTVDGRLIQANPAFVRILRYKSMEELVNIPVQNLYQDPKDRERFISILKTKGQINNFEVCSKRADNTPGWGSLCAAYVKGKGASMPTIWGSLIDISERKFAEEQLRQSEEKYAKTFKTSPDAIILSSLADGIFFDSNDSFTRITGYTREEVLGRSAMKDDLGIWVKNEDRERLVKMIKDQDKDETIELETEFRCKDGHIIYCIMSARIIEISGEKYILSITRDITEKRKLLEAAQINQRLESLGALAGGIAHDFNNLLSGIYGNVELALRKTNDKTITEHLIPVITSLKRATSLTHQLLTFAKGGIPVMKVAPLFPFVNKIVDFALSGSAIKCGYSISPQLLNCKYDENQIAQVIDNIIINAAQAMQNNGNIFIHAKNIRITDDDPHALSSGDYICISFKDHGTGIPKDILPRIYDPFFSTKETGSGLGLTTCYSIINRHGGCIEVESFPGKGSVFFIYLPATKEKPAEKMIKQAVKHKGSGTVIVMDDDVIVRWTVCSMLKDFGYDTIPAKNGEEVIAAFNKSKEEKTPIKALLLDLTIAGGMGGKTALEEIRKIDKDVPAFLSSGYSDDIVMSQPGKFGFTGSLHKPFLMADLEALFEHHFGSQTQV